jgi:hypothetical protein
LISWLRVVITRAIARTPGEFKRERPGHHISRALPEKPDVDAHVHIVSLSLFLDTRPGCRERAAVRAARSYTIPFVPGHLQRTGRAARRARVHVMRCIPRPFCCTIDTRWVLKCGHFTAFQRPDRPEKHF